jgi:hypothetical protein
MNLLHGPTIRVFAALLFLIPASLSAQTVTAPSGAVAVPTSGDYFSSAFQDPADMNHRTDIGWFAYGVDQPRANLSGISVANGVFSATAASNDPNIYLLETGNPVSVPLGRRGDVQLIDANRYRTLAIRMRLNGAQGARASDGQLIWTTRTIYDSPTSVAGSFAVYGGWQVYLLDIPSLGVAAGNAWQGLIGSLRLDPTVVAGQTIEIDWARLVSNDAQGMRTITWSGGGAVDIYLDNDTSEANGTLGLIARNGTTLSRNVSGGSFAFQPGALPAGNYYVAMRTAGTSNALRYSSGYYQVEGVPTLNFTSPSPEGSNDDFATTQLGNPWDMDSPADIDAVANVTAAGIAIQASENAAGTSLGNQRVYRASGLSGDPILYMLAGHRRGAAHPIDPNRYRIATIDVGLAGDRYINGGSIARIVWRQKGDTAETVSEDIIINHRAGTNVLDTISVDMKTLPIEPAPGSPSRTGWVGTIDEFRFDPHEFTPANDFWVRRVKLAALERAGSSYRIAWAYDAQSSSATLSLWYDSDRSGFDGTRIVDGVAPTAGAYTWNTAGLVPGQEYYIYSQLTDSTGRVVSRGYAQWPIVGGGSAASPAPAPAPAPGPAVSRPSMSVDLPASGSTVAQPFAITGWAVDGGSSSGSGIDFLDIWAYPNPGSGAAAVYLGQARTGASRPDIGAAFGTQFAAGGYGIAVKGLPPAVYQIVAFAHSTVTGTFVDTRTVTVQVNANPRMSIDAPGNNQTVGQPFLVAGWATDLAAASGTGVDAVQVWAYPNPGSGTPARFVGHATLGGARPDVAAFFGPNAERSGYGLMASGLPAGVYDLAVFMHSTVLGTFTNVQVVRITVR